MSAEFAEQVANAEREWMDHWKAGPSRLRWAETPLQAGDPAPDFELEDATGRPVRISSFWAERPALLLFWRHYGCGCGMDRADGLQKEYEEYVRAGANVLVIGQGEPARATAYAAKYGVPCPVLCDPELEVYKAYGLPEFSPAQVLYDAPDEYLIRNLEAGKKLAEARRKLGRPLVDNPWQSPGEFLVDAEGIIRLAYRYQYCEDYPDPRVLVAAIRFAAGALPQE